MFLTKTKMALSYLLLAGVPLYFSHSPVWALSSDRSRPMHIEADLADIDDKTGISIYTGSVVVVQGSLRITADKLTVYSKNRTFEKMISTGNPTTFKTRPDGKDKDVLGEGKKIEYLTIRDTVYFIEDAKLEQDGSKFNSDRIVYDILNDKVNAGITKGDNRVKIIIQPKKQ